MSSCASGISRTDQCPKLDIVYLETHHSDNSIFARKHTAVRLTHTILFLKLKTAKRVWPCLCGSKLKAERWACLIRNKHKLQFNNLNTKNGGFNLDGVYWLDKIYIVPCLVSACHVSVYLTFKSFRVIFTS